MNANTGRPPLPKGQARDVQIGVRFTADEDKAIQKAISDSGQSKAEWMRTAAVAQAKTIWVKSKWSMEELDNQNVEFRLTAPRLQVTGLGKFLVRRNPRGELAINICAITEATRHQITEARYYIGQAAADKIERHPNANVAAFRLLG
jgi:uncharacterized protein (DUF1778 family)